MKVLVVGGGIFGVTAALELRARGHDVTIVDPGPLPHPLAESTDISKVVRCDYGGDVGYTELGERALEGWRRWNRAWPVPRFHETGVAFLARTPMQPGGFEHDSFVLLEQRGHRIERLDSRAIAARFPAYHPDAFVDGYFHADGGWAEAAMVVSHLLAAARSEGVTIREHCAIDRIEPGVALCGTERIATDVTVVCAGSWTQRLVPELAGSLRAIGQPVFHFAPADPTPFEAPRFPVFGGDLSRTGYYGFPANRGVVKIANHGRGRELGEDRDVPVTAEQTAAVRAFVAATFPALTDAPITYTRTCVYGDTVDGHFWIAPHPERPDLVVAAGGSGHAFKFAPVLGRIIARAVEGDVEPRFRWRPQLSERSRGDAARSDYQ